jgi:hypothetical protein
MAVDVEGNCRFYDLVRFQKLAKIKPNIVRDSERSGPLSYRLMLDGCLKMSQDAFYAVVQTPKIMRHVGPEPKYKAKL